MNKVFCWGDMKERDHLEELCIDGKTILNLILNKLDVRAWTGFIWLWINTSGGMWLKRY